jgi:hypothetical protein
VTSISRVILTAWLALPVTARSGKRRAVANQDHRLVVPVAKASVGGIINALDVVPR